MSKPVLKLDWCSHETAKYAVEKWHYSHQLPPFPHVRVGVWEDGVFIGCILFARGATQNLLSPYGLRTTEGAELVRVALAAHRSPVSRVLAIALRMVKKEYPTLRLIVSFADPAHSHHGGIYQATGWLYAGQTSPSKMYRDKKGKTWHERVCCEIGTKRAFGKVRVVPRPSECVRIDLPGKYRYLMPLDDDMRQRIAPLAKPYPKRPRAGSSDSGTPADQAGGGGANPTPALSTVDKVTS